MPFVRNDQLTTTQIVSFPVGERGRPVMKSSDMSSQGRVGIGSGVYSPWDGGQIWFVGNLDNVLRTS